MEELCTKYSWICRIVASRFLSCLSAQRPSVGCLVQCITLLPHLESFYCSLVDPMFLFSNRISKHVSSIIDRSRRLRVFVMQPAQYHRSFPLWSTVEMFQAALVILLCTIVCQKIVAPFFGSRWTTKSPVSDRCSILASVRFRSSDPKVSLAPLHQEIHVQRN